MPEEKKTQEQEPQETEVVETEESTEEEPEDETQEVEESEEEPKEEEPADEEIDLERAKAKIAKVNSEAHELRKKLRDTEEKLKEAKTPEEVDAIIKQLTEERETTEHELLRENVALKFKLPEKAIKRLAGKTREELEADAKELADLFGTDEDDDEDIDLEGGLTPRNRDDADPADPASLARKYGRRGKRR